MRQQTDAEVEPWPLHVATALWLQKLSRSGGVHPPCLRGSPEGSWWPGWRPRCSHEVPPYIHPGSCPSPPSAGTAQEITNDFHIHIICVTYNLSYSISILLCDSFVVLCLVHVVELTMKDLETLNVNVKPVHRLSTLSLSSSSTHHFSNTWNLDD